MMKKRKDEEGEEEEEEEEGVEEEEEEEVDFGPLFDMAAWTPQSKEKKKENSRKQRRKFT